MCSTTIVALLFVVPLIKAGYTTYSTNKLECYTCSSRDTYTCRYPNRYETPIRICGAAALNETEYLVKNISYNFGEIFHVDISSHHPLLPLNCLKHVIKVGNEHVIIRGCQLAAYENMDICRKAETRATEHLRSHSCNLCNTNLCNSAQSRNMSLIVCWLLFISKGIMKTLSFYS